MQIFLVKNYLGFGKGRNDKEAVEEFEKRNGKISDYVLRVYEVDTEGWEIKEDALLISEEVK